MTATNAVLFTPMYFQDNKMKPSGAKIHLIPHGSVCRLLLATFIKT